MSERERVSESEREGDLFIQLIIQLGTHLRDGVQVQAKGIHMPKSHRVSSSLLR